MADFRRQTPAGELQISVAEITEAADPLGPRLETPLVFSIARFPFAKRKSSFPIGEPEVRIHLPPAKSQVRTCIVWTSVSGRLVPALVALSVSGTSGSNPPSSSGEAGANLTLGIVNVERGQQIGIS